MFVKIGLNRATIPVEKTIYPKPENVLSNIPGIGVWQEVDKHL